MKNLFQKISSTCADALRPASIALSAALTAAAMAGGCSEPVTSTCSFRQPNGQVVEYGCGEGFKCAANQAICISNGCGNGIVEKGEECDDGNRQNGDGCSKDCRLEVCGNGVLDPIKYDETTGTYVQNEVCDPGIDDKCSPDCKSNLACGNGIVDPQEACDHGLGENSDVGTTDCSADCSSDMSCGNGKLDTGYKYVPQAMWEQCDKGDPDNDIPAVFPAEYQTLESARCTNDCKISFCGNGIIEEGEDCDNGLNDTATCTKNCTASRCGDGYVNSVNEDCDPQIPMDVDGKSISSHCHPETCKMNACGDGFKGYNVKLGYEEQCEVTDDDDANARCNLTTCKLNVCGDNYIGISKDEETGLDRMEECDDGPSGSTTCTKKCTRSMCHDGILNEASGEECDPGSVEETRECNSNCTNSKCGDTIWNKAAGEECDSGEHGSKNCTSKCMSSTCGDGVWNTKAGEECDPGTPEGERYPVHGYNACAEGSVDTSEEECDRTLICNSNCTLSRCGDGILNTVGGEEQCDDGEDEKVGNVAATVLRFQDAVEAFCKGLTDDTAMDRYVFTGDDDVRYSFCSGNGDGTWRLSLEEEVQDGGRGQSSKQRRAAAEYYYTHTYLIDARYQGRCYHDCGAIQCGNGVIDVGEVCDGGGEGGSIVDGLGGAVEACSEDCRSTLVCGNGVIDTEMGEVCDPPVNGCKACTSGLTCGNGTVEPGEQCDTGSEGAKGNGFCVITANDTVMDSTWNRVIYRDEPTESVSKEGCEGLKGLWDGAKCYEPRNCIAESVFEKCLAKSASYASCDKDGEKLDACYTGLAEGEDACGGDDGSELVTVCISKSCQLAYCGDGFLHEGVEQCDHGQGKLASNEGLCANCEALETDAEKAACVEGCIDGMKGLQKGEHCNYNCAKNVCGDGIVNAFADEVCDWGDRNGLTECPNGAKGCEVCAGDCRSMVRIGCGDGFVNTASPFNEACDHMEAKAEGLVCDQDHKENCKSFASPEDCLTYPCRVCEGCAVEKTYNSVASSRPREGGMVVSDAIGLSCSSTQTNPSKCLAYTTLSQVTVNAIPVEGWELKSWGLGEGSPCTVSGAGDRTLTCSFTGESGSAVIAPVFEKGTYSVTASLSEAAAGKILGTCTGGACTCEPAEGGPSVTCTGVNTDGVSFTAMAEGATETSGRYVFTKWTEGCPRVSYDTSGNPVCSGDIGTGWNLTAVMERQYLVTYASSDATMGAVSGSVPSGTSASVGTSVSLLAAPVSTYEFTGWTLSGGYACAIQDSTLSAAMQNPCVLTLEGTKGDLSAEGGFVRSTPSISASAVAVAGGVESAPAGASYEMSCQCREKGVASYAPCATDEGGRFVTTFGSTCEISYAASDPDGLYVFSTWAGCTSFTDTTCTIGNVVNVANPVKAVFAKNRHGISFAAEGMLAGESLAYRCAVVTMDGQGGEAVAPKTDCSGVYDRGTIVRVYLDQTSSDCRSHKHVVLTADQASAEEALATAAYDCQCSEQGGFDDCVRDGETVAGEVTLDVVMSRDRVVSATLANSGSLTLSSADHGDKKENLHGSVTGQAVASLEPPQGGDVAPTTFFSCNSKDCYPAAVDKGTMVKMIAVADTGYSLAAWKVDDGYLKATPTDNSFIVSAEEGTIRFQMGESHDVTPVFLPVLSASISPTDAGTMECFVTNCSASSSGTGCDIEAIDDEGGLYDGFAQTIECATLSGASCTLATCQVAVTPVASVKMVVTLNAGYQSSGWGDDAGLVEGCTALECNVTDMATVDSITLAASQQTGSLNLIQNANSKELSKFVYHHADTLCKAAYSNEDTASHDNCSNYYARADVKYITNAVGESGWASNDYYSVAVPNSKDRDVVLVCPENKYRCVDNENSLAVSGDWKWSDYGSNESYDGRRLRALTSLKDKFNVGTGSCEKKYSYVQCLFRFSSSSVATVQYNDISFGLTLAGTSESGLNLSGTWENANSGSVGTIASFVIGETVSIAQNSRVTVDASLNTGYSVKKWKIGSQEQKTCENKAKCTFDMPTRAVTLTVETMLSDVSLTTTAYGDGSFLCTSYKGNKCEDSKYNNCGSSYSYDSHICIKATPGTDYEFLAGSNEGGCPGGSWTVSDGVGVCQNVAMTGDRTVSALFTHKPVVEFSSNVADCPISCNPASACTAASSGSVPVTSNGQISFSAPVICGESYEFLAANNELTCPVATGGWSVGTDVATCGIASVTGPKTVHGIYSQMPSLAFTMGAGGSVVNCDGSEGTASFAGGRLPSGKTEAVCVQADATHELAYYEGCPSTQGWQEISAGVFKCAVTMDGDKSIAVRFTDIGAVKLSILTLGGSGAKCATIASEAACGSVADEARTACASEVAMPLNSRVCVYPASVDPTVRPVTCQVTNALGGDGWASDGYCQVTNDGSNALAKTAVILFEAVPPQPVAVAVSGEGSVKCAIAAECGDGLSYRSENCSNVQLLEGQHLCVNAVGTEMSEPSGCTVTGQTNNWDGASGICDVPYVSSNTTLATVSFTRKMTVTVTQPESSASGTIGCQVIQAAGCAGAADEGFAACDASYAIGAGEALCVKATPAEGFELDAAASICAGGTWSDGNCAVPYSAGGSASVAADFATVPEVKMTVTVGQPVESAGGGIGCQVVQAADCAGAADAGFGACDASYAIGAGEALCVKAAPAEGFELDAAASVCGGGAWSSSICWVPYAAVDGVSVSASFTASVPEPTP